VFITSKERMIAQIIFLQTRCCALYLVESVCFTFSFVGPLMQSLKQRTARKASLQSILPLLNFGIFICKIACPNLMCRRHFLFSYVCLTRQLHTTPSKEYMSAVSLQSTSLSVKPCHTDCKSSPTWSVRKGTQR